MQGRRSLSLDLTPFIDNIDRIGRNFRRMGDNQRNEGAEGRDQEGLPFGNRAAAAAPPPPLAMKNYARPVISSSTSCILLGEAARNYDLKNIHYNQLPSFYGMPNEDALTFIRDFYATVETFPLQTLNEDQLRMRCFPYTLKDRAKTWFMTLAPGSLTNWEMVYNKFMGKFYSHQKTSQLRTQIATFTQLDGEPFHEAWERFRMLLNQCPHHNYPLPLQNQFFYDGLTQQCQYMVDNAAGGAMGEKTAEETYELYEMLGANSQQKSVRGRKTAVKEVSSVNEMAFNIAELTKQVKILATRQVQQQEVCGVCQAYGHGANTCELAQKEGPVDEEFGEANFLNGQRSGWNNGRNNFGGNQKYDPFSNTYNPGFRDHPNFSWRNNNPQPPQNQGVQADYPKKPSLEESLNTYIQINQQRMNSLEASMKKMETQIGQLASHIQIPQKGKLPSQPEQAHSISTVRCEHCSHETKVVEKKKDAELEKVEEIEKEEDKSPLRVYKPKIPFPGRLFISEPEKKSSPLRKEKAGKVSEEEEVEKKEKEREILAAVKENDPGSFIIKVGFGNGEKRKALLDLGASINVMPYSMYEDLGLKGIKPTQMAITMADGTLGNPKGIIENVKLKVGTIDVPVDLVVMKIEGNKFGGAGSSLLLGRPFMATSKMSIDVFRRVVKMELNGQILELEDSNPKTSTPLIEHVNLCDAEEIWPEKLKNGKTQVWAKAQRSKLE